MKALVGITIIVLIVTQSACTFYEKGRPPASIRDFSLAGETGAWVVTADGAIFRLYSDGRPATKLNVEYDVRQVYFLSQTDGWILDSTGQFWSTSNAGEVWAKKGKLMRDSVGHFGGQLAFASPNVGWFLNGTEVWLTEDGGDSWSKVYPNKPTDLGQPTSFLPLDVHSGWLALSTGGLLKTTTRGKSWEPVGPNVDASITSIFAFGLDRCFAPVSEGGGIYATEDGGMTWRQKLTPGVFEGIGLSAVTFSSPENGWAVGIRYVQDATTFAKPNGITFRTRNGGESWSEEKGEFYRKNFVKAYFSDPSNGWLVGENSIFRTNDGGSSWRETFSARPRR